MIFSPLFLYWKSFVICLPLHLFLFSSSLTELFELQDEEDKVLEMIQKLPHVTKFAEDREKISNECIELASKFFSSRVCLFVRNLCIVLHTKLYTLMILFSMYNVAENCIYSITNFLCSMHLKCFQPAD